MKKLWIWRHLGIRLPDDWEMLQYSLKLESGRCAFADRYGFRFELTWRQVDGPPDFDRMLSDYMGKLKDEGMTQAHRIEVSGCQGFKGEMDGQTITRFGRYAESESCLVELLFPWPDGRNRELESAILQSFHEVPLDANNCRRWRALGMDARVPGRLTLSRCRVEPALVEWHFSDPRKQTVFRCARRGLVQEWMDHSVQAWLERQVRPDSRPPARWRHERRDGHAVDRIEGRAAARGWLRRKRHLQAEAWVCPVDGRLYSWVAEDAPALPGNPLNSCGEA
ncbi:MAG: hypothetical protein ISS31_01805 [Kiritimatiellae bacterium]|nr:hypothetical protein [Kiritimatiellia bacterium]